MPLVLTADKYLTDAQLAQLRAYVRQRADRARRHHTRRGVEDEFIVELLLGTGLRASELIALDLFDLPGAHGKMAVMVRHGKGDKARIVHIGLLLFGRINDYVLSYRANAKPEQPLFVNQRGARITYQTLLHKIQNLGKKAGLSLFSQSRHGCHVLRHTYATQLYHRTKDLRLVQQQLGHSSPTITAVYAHVELDEQTQAVLNTLSS